MALDSCDSFAQVPQIAADAVQATVHLRKAGVHSRKAASEFSPYVGHVASLLGLPLEKHSEKKSGRGNGRGYFSGAYPCPLAH